MNTTKQTLQLFWEHARAYPALLWGILIGIPVAVIGPQVVQPIIVSQVLNKLASQDFGQNSLADFVPYLLAFIGIAALGTILGWRVVTWCMWQLELRAVRDLQNRVLEHLLHQSVHFHINRFSGSLVSQAQKLTSAFITLAETIILTIIPTLLLVGAISAYMLPLVPWFVVVVDTFVVLFIIGAAIISHKIQPLNLEHSNALNTQTGQLADVLGNVTAVKSFAAEQTELATYRAASDLSQQKGRRAINAIAKAETYYSGVTVSLGFGALISAIIIATTYRVDIGLVYLMLSYSLMIVYRVWDFKAVIKNFTTALSDAAEMTTILHQKPDVLDNKNPQNLHVTKGKITFKDISFTHPETGEDDGLFRDFSLTIKPGERIGLVGHSGSGKTTLTKLLLRFADLDKGVISIDGQDIAQVAQTDLRAHIAYVPQEPLLFHRSIKENIAYGQPQATDEQIKTAAQKAHALEFIDKLPKGFDTLVGERGVKLSGGQRQRIAIARAILKDAPILVLDEATSALDSESEQKIQTALGELMKGRTTIVVAHRLSTVQKMDRIIVLDQGKIIEEGPHATLLDQQGVYSGLWRHQSGNFLEP